ncbi:MAG: YaaC family protein [Bacilli bacterium]
MNFAHFRSELPVLQILENPLLVKHILSAIHSSRRYGEGLYESAFAVCSAFAQGRAFLEAGETASPRTQPVLFYYGLLNYAKGCIVLSTLSGRKLLATYKHGVSTPRKKSRYNYFSDAVRVERTGVFPDWYEAVQLLRRKAHHTGAPGFPDADPDRHGLGKSGALSGALSGATFPVDQLWATVPGTWPVLEELGIAPRYERLAVISVNQSQTTYSVQRGWAARCGLPLETWIGLLRSHDSGTSISSIEFPSADMEAQSIVLETDSSGKIACHDWWIPTISETHDQTLAIPPLPQHLLESASLSEPFVQYLLAFHLSMLSRYEPEHWGDLVNDQSSVEFLMMAILAKRIATTTSAFYGRLLLPFLDH